MKYVFHIRKELVKSCDVVPVIVSLRSNAIFFSSNILILRLLSIDIVC